MRTFSKKFKSLFFLTKRRFTTEYDMSTEKYLLNFQKAQDSIGIQQKKIRKSYYKFIINNIFYKDDNITIYGIPIDNEKNSEFQQKEIMDHLLNGDKSDISLIQLDPTFLIFNKRRISDKYARQIIYKNQDVDMV